VKSEVELARLIKLVFCLCILSTTSRVFAQEDAFVNEAFLPTSANHASWVFSGVVTNENSENYGYFFQMQRDDDNFHAKVALFDERTKKLLFQDESQAKIHDPKAYHWQVGRAFLRFNPINDSWIFGLKPKNEMGFNFKVDMQKQPEEAPVAEDLRQGVEFLVSQTTHLNGHVQLGTLSKEQFVTAKNAWFRQVWVTETQTKGHPLKGVFCRFSDGSGFYSVNMKEADALKGAVSGWWNRDGVASLMSQFITVKQAQDGPWHIRVAEPRLHLVLSEGVNDDAIVAGFVEKDKAPGFCMLSNEDIGVATS
jgi:hypothetical protein